EDEPSVLLQNPHVDEVLGEVLGPFGIAAERLAVGLDGLTIALAETRDSLPCLVAVAGLNDLDQRSPFRGRKKFLAHSRGSLFVDCESLTRLRNNFFREISEVTIKGPNHGFIGKRKRA